MGALTRERARAGARRAAPTSPSGAPGFPELVARARGASSACARACTSSTTPAWAASASATRTRCSTLVRRRAPRTSASSSPGSGPTSPPPTSPTSSFFGEQLARFAELAGPLAASTPGCSCTPPTAPRRCASPHRTSTWSAAGSRSTASTRSRRDPAAHGLEPALELRSYVADVKRFEPGASAGYGRTLARRRRTTWVGVLPIGYGDGVRRGLTNNAEVLVGGRRYPLVGTVSMDNVTVDLGPETEVEPGATAVLIGAQGDERILAEEVARAPRHDQLRDHLRDLAAGAAESGERVSAGVASARRRARRARPPRGAGRRGRRWIVGGAVRDALLGREVTDVDLAVAGRRAEAARARSRRAAGGHAFELSERVRDLAGWPRRRRLARRRHARCAARTSRPTSALRDFTVNAIAVPLATRRRSRSTRTGGLRRPRGAGAARRLRPRASPTTRCGSSRAARLAAGARLRARARDASTLARAAAGRAARAGGRAPVRGAARCSRRARPGRGLELLDELGATAGRAAGARGAARRRARTRTTTSTSTGTRSRCCAQLLEVEARPRALRGRQRRGRSRSCSPSRSPTGSRGGDALRFGALLHDIGKPATRAETRAAASPSSATTARAPRSSRELCARLRGQPRRSRAYLAGADPPPPAPRLPGPRAAAVAPRASSSTCERTEPESRRRHPAHGRRPARRPRGERRPRARR